MKYVVLSLFSLLLLVSCEPPDQVTEEEYLFRKDLRLFVSNFASRAHSVRSDFIIIGEGAPELALKSYCYDCATSVDGDFIQSINGVSVKAMFYGEDGINSPNSSTQTEDKKAYTSLYRERNKSLFVTDFANSPSAIDNAYDRIHAFEAKALVADSYELSSLPEYPAIPIDVNSRDIRFISETANFLYLNTPEGFSSKSQYLQHLANSQYDLLIIDAFYEGQLLSKEDLNSLSNKPQGGHRLILATIDIGSAFQQRFYWKQEWNQSPPAWLKADGRVEYWNSEWQDIIFSGNESYLNKVLAAGFDGAVLQGLDAYKAFEND